MVNCSLVNLLSSNRWFIHLFSKNSSFSTQSQSYHNIKPIFSPNSSLESTSVMSVIHILKTNIYLLNLNDFSRTLNDFCYFLVGLLYTVHRFDHFCAGGLATAISTADWQHRLRYISTITQSLARFLHIIITTQRWTPRHPTWILSVPWFSPGLIIHSPEPRYLGQGTWIWNLVENPAVSL